MKDMKTNWGQNRTERPTTALHRLIIMILCLCAMPCETLRAATPADSTFSVESFRKLPTDVSAFIDAVHDLNGEACALIKVVGPSDFAFSSPLGIVKRSDQVGEIWLYLPKGTKQITIKHPKWGVLRNWQLGMKLESRMTYELRLRTPLASVVEKHDTIVYTQTVVDTVKVVPQRRVVPVHGYALLTASLHTDGPSWGVMLAVMRKVGAYLHVSTNLHSAQSTTGSCLRDGTLTDGSRKPYFTGRTQNAAYSMTAGLIHRVGNHIDIFEGVGYARKTTAWQLTDSEGGGWLRNESLSHKGVSGELGVIATIGKLSISASALTIGGKQWQGCIGVGIRLGKAKVVMKPYKQR